MALSTLTIRYWYTLDAPLDSELSQPLGERAPEPRPLGVPERDVPQDPYPVHFARLLRLNDERRGEEAEGEASHERPPVHYWLTPIT